ncbi:hypothetical protein QQ045_007224 [Rhodiola kirilowii]
MGALDHFYEIFDLSYWHRVRQQNKALKKKKLRQLQRIEIRIKMDCEGCERRVRQSVETMKRVTKVEVNTKQHKLTVMGYVEPEKVLKRVKAKTGKAAQFWPYVPYDIVPHPYAPGSYDKKAPSGHVRNVFTDPGKAGDLARVNSMEARILSAFSEDNAHACVIM